jgi:hypothetical protein
MKNTGTIRSPKEHLGNPKEPVDASAIRNARHAAMANRAVTAQAKRFVDHVFAQVAQSNGSERPRGSYGKTKEQLQRGVEGFLGDLLRAAGNEHAKGYVYRSLHGGSFIGEDVGRIAFRLMIDRLQELGLIDHRRGYQNRFRWEAGGPEVVGRASASRFRATPQLLELAESFGVRVGDAKHHFITGLPKHPLQVRRSSRRDKQGQKSKGSLMPLKQTPQTAALEAEVRELNEFFDGFELRGGTHRGFIRRFNKGDDEHFAWNLGGRLYSQGEDNFQLMKPEDRLLMTIDGEAVCEIDIRASFLTIYHGWFNQQLDWDTDPYDRLPGVPRDIAKTWFTATFGHEKHLQKWPREASSDYRDGTGPFKEWPKDRVGRRKLGRDYALKTVREKAVEKFPVLENWGKRRESWAELMYLESAAVVATMLRLKREYQVPSLSVHDSLIVPLSNQEVAERVLSEEYTKVTKARPKLKTSTAS